MSFVASKSARTGVRSTRSARGTCRRWRASLVYVALTCIGAYSAAASADNALLSWTPPTANTDGTALTDLAGYRLYSGCVASGQYERPPLTLVSVSSYDLGGLPSVGTCYFALTALNAGGLESVRSNEAAKLMGVLAPPSTPTVGPTITWSRRTVMGITRDSTVYNGVGGTGTSQSKSDVTIPSGRDFALVHITYYKTGGVGVTISSMSLDGHSATKVEEVTASNNSWYQDLWFVSGFSAGSSKTLSYTVNATSDFNHLIEIAFFSGGDISSGLTSLKRWSGSIQSTSGSDPDHVTLSAVASAGDYIVGGYGADSGPATLDAGSAFGAHDGSPPYGALFEITSASGTTTIGVNGHFPAFAAIAMIPAAGGGGGTTQQTLMLTGVGP